MRRIREKLRKRARYYGIPIEALVQLILTADGRCMNTGCGRKTDRLHLDHNHTTGKYREYLCRKCNSILGFAGEDERVLLGLVDYLRRHG